MRVIVITGQSGAGKTVALNTLEDMGWYCIDNLPAGLLAATIQHLHDSAGKARERTAVAIDARTPGAELDTAVEAVQRLRREGLDVSVVFLQASAESLLKRYSETRRRHPLSSPSVSLREAIGRETEMLSTFALESDLRIDTTRLSIYELRDRLRTHLDPNAGQGLSVLVQSFGFKYGVPTDADYVFDVRCLPNPYWEADLRDLSGRDEAVARFLESHASAQQMFHSIREFLTTWLPSFETGTRSYLTVAIGCTGGHHRSVYIAERLLEGLSDQPYQIQLRHRELA